MALRGFRLCENAKAELIHRRAVPSRRRRIDCMTASEILARSRSEQSGRSFGGCGGLFRGGEVRVLAIQISGKQKSDFGGIIDAGSVGVHDVIVARVAFDRVSVRSSLDTIKPSGVRKNLIWLAVRSSKLICGGCSPDSKLLEGLQRSHITSVRAPAIGRSI